MMEARSDVSKNTSADLMLDIINVKKAFGELEVLKGIDLQVTRGQIVSIIGSSGSGKSTLLRSINHLETIDAGEIWLDGVRVNQPGMKGLEFERHINSVRQNMGMVFQQFNLFPHLSTLDNVRLAPIKLKGMDKREATTFLYGVAGKSWFGRKSRDLPLKPVRWTKTACRDSARTGNAAKGDAF